MLEAALQVLIAPALVGAATLASRRWGLRIGGLVSAFPAIVGPVLLITAQQQGEAFAARAAVGTMLGLVALSGFALVYGRVALRAAWPVALLAAWLAAAGIAAVVGSTGGGTAAGLAAASLSLVAAHRALPRGGGEEAVAAPRWDLPLRMAMTVLLVVSLAAAAARLGPLVGGLLAALPVLASVLVVFTHEQQGAAAAAGLLRGMLSGMAGFVAFCLLVALLVESAGVPAAFTAAALAAVAAQGVAVAARSEDARALA